MRERAVVVNWESLRKESGKTKREETSTLACAKGCVVASPAAKEGFIKTKLARHAVYQ